MSEIVCKCGHAASMHFRGAGCEAKDNSKYCPCDKSPREVEDAALRTQLTEAEVVLKQYADKNYWSSFYGHDGHDVWLQSTDGCEPAAAYFAKYCVIITTH